MVAVIGDVHGCYYTLKTLVEEIRLKYPSINIYCVGDLVDRGNFNYEVIEYIKSQEISFTPGNHDYMFYAHFRYPGSSMAKTWLYNGSESTLKSYQNKSDILEVHLDVINNAPIFIDTDDCFISHAGISNKHKTKLPEDILSNLSELNNFLSLDLSDINSILWCRTELLNIGKLQVVGHTHRKEVYYNSYSNTVYIDTTAFGFNKLSAAIINKNKVVEIMDQKTFAEDTDSRWNYYL